MSNTHFECKSSHKCTRMVRCQDGVEVMSMIGLVLVKRNMLHYVQEEWDKASQIIMFCFVKLSWWMHGLRVEK